MAGRDAKNASTDPVADETARQLRRIANLLALLATKGETQAEKIVTMSAVGFSASEVAALVRTTPNVVAVTVYQSKKRSRSSSPKKRRG